MRSTDNRLVCLADKQNNSFGVVRIAAAAAVIISHAFLLVRGENAQPLFEWTSFDLGGHAVHVFFILSGFLIAASWERNSNIIDFLSGRFARIYPALFVVTIGTILTIGLFQSNLSFQAFLASSHTIELFLRVVVALDGGGRLPGIFQRLPAEDFVLATVWTIRYEVICYLSIPIVAGFGFFRREGGTLFIVGALLAMASLIYLQSWFQTEPSLFRNLVRFFFAFYLGVGAWKFRRLIPVSSTIMVLLAVVTLVNLQTDQSLIIEIIATGYLAFWVGSLNFGWFGALVNRHDVSYGVYLIGFPLQQTWNQIFTGEHAVMTNILLTFAVALPLAFLSWHYVEKPALRHRHTLSGFIHRIVGYAIRQHKLKTSA